MTNDELLDLLVKWQNPHYKYKMRARKPFILYIKNPKLPRKVFYVRYTEDRIVLSTGETDIGKATKFAIEHLNDHTPEGMQAYNKRDEFHKLLQDYYKLGSEHIDYCIIHNRKISEKERPTAESMMLRICGLTPDVHKFKDLTKKRLIKLQEDLLNTDGKYGKLSVKTVKNHFTHLERIYKELLDKDIIDYNPFSGLPPLKNEISQAWDCFPISPFKHKLPIIPFDNMQNYETDFVYSLLGYIAIMTGQRKEEISAMKKDSVIFQRINSETRYWLYVDGTKTNNASRTIPITETTAYAIKVFCKLKENNLMKYLKDVNYNKECLLYFGQFCGYDTLEKIKNGNNGKSKIVFHGFRKMYKTFLTQENINKDLIEYCMGHKSKMAILRNRYSNVNDTYLVLEKSDNLTAHKEITKALAYFECENNSTLWTLQGFLMGLEKGLSLKSCYKFSEKYVQEKYKSEYGNAIWG